MPQKYIESNGICAMSYIFNLKINVILLCGLLAVSLCGCGVADTHTPPSQAQSAVTATVTVTHSVKTASPTLIPTAPPTAAPTATAEPTATAAPTASPTATPTATDTPTATTAPKPTKKPTAAPKPSPKPQFTLPEASEITKNCSITFAAHPYGMPSDSLSVYEGIGFNMRGTITSDSPLTKAWLTATDSRGNVYTATVSLKASQNITILALEGDDSLDAGHVTDNLENGKCLIELYAQSTSHPSAACLYSSRFDKLPDTKMRLTPNSFRGDFYSSALSFFKDESAFIFTFTHDSGRHIKQDKAWVSNNIVTVTDWQNNTVPVHRLAAPYFEKAYGYIANTLLRVRSASFDTGVIPLSDVAAVTYGAYVSRFVSGKRFVSHHALGTAQDINADYPSNVNDKKNHKVIADEVALLEYEGLLTDRNGNRYHSFVYNGTCSDIRGKVPQTISNYLIYELAFFRAGFCWGYYYDHTCDAMHFSLTELPLSTHEAENGGLRKVYSYQ